MEGRNTILSLINLTKSFLQRGVVLDNLNLEVNEGDSIAFTGPSGSGKTTLMNLIGLLDIPDSGDIIFKGRKISGYTGDESAGYRSQNIGFVFQDHLLLPYLTIHENILLPLSAGNRSKSWIEERQEHLLDLMQKAGIDGLANKYPFQVSGGEAQRAALVRSLANNPSILLADEPTGSLDAANASLMGDLLLEMNSKYGTTIIVATHSPELARRMALRFRLENGKLIRST
jgi:lipoprotein-releasing system ATP-binding protein